MLCGRAFIAPKCWGDITDLAARQAAIFASLVANRLEYRAHVTIYNAPTKVGLRGETKQCRRLLLLLLLLTLRL